jgi:hypothetical protein
VEFSRPDKKTVRVRPIHSIPRVATVVLIEQLSPKPKEEEEEDGDNDWKGKTGAKKGGKKKK